MFQIAGTPTLDSDRITFSKMLQLLQNNIQNGQDNLHAIQSLTGQASNSIALIAQQYESLQKLTMKQYTQNKIQQKPISQADQKKLTPAKTITEIYTQAIKISLSVVKLDQTKQPTIASQPGMSAFKNIKLPHLYNSSAFLKDEFLGIWQPSQFNQFQPNRNTLVPQKSQGFNNLANQPSSQSALATQTGISTSHSVGTVVPPPLLNIGAPPPLNIGPPPPLGFSPPPLNIGPPPPLGFSPPPLSIGSPPPLGFSPPPLQMKGQDRSASISSARQASKSQQLFIPDLYKEKDSISQPLVTKLDEKVSNLFTAVQPPKQVQQFHNQNKSQQIPPAPKQMTVQQQLALKFKKKNQQSSLIQPQIKQFQPVLQKNQTPPPSMPTISAPILPILPIKKQQIAKKQQMSRISINSYKSNLNLLQQADQEDAIFKKSSKPQKKQSKENPFAKFKKDDQEDDTFMSKKPKKVQIPKEQKKGIFDQDDDDQLFAKPIVFKKKNVIPVTDRTSTATTFNMKSNQPDSSRMTTVPISKSPLQQGLFKPKAQLTLAASSSKPIQQKKISKNPLFVNPLKTQKQKIQQVKKIQPKAQVKTQTKAKVQPKFQVKQVKTQAKVMVVAQSKAQKKPQPITINQKESSPKVQQKKQVFHADVQQLLKKHSQGVQVIPQRKSQIADDEDQFRASRKKKRPTKQAFVADIKQTLFKSQAQTIQTNPMPFQQQKKIPSKQVKQIKPPLIKEQSQISHKIQQSNPVFPPPLQTPKQLPIQQPISKTIPSNQNLLIKPKSTSAQPEAKGLGLLGLPAIKKTQPVIKNDLPLKKQPVLAQAQPPPKQTPQPFTQSKKVQPKKNKSLFDDDDQQDIFVKKPTTNVRPDKPLQPPLINKPATIQKPVIISSVGQPHSIAITKQTPLSSGPLLLQTKKSTVSGSSPLEFKPSPLASAKSPLSITPRLESKPAFTNPLSSNKQSITQPPQQQKKASKKLFDQDSQEDQQQQMRKRKQQKALENRLKFSKGQD